MKCAESFGLCGHTTVAELHCLRLLKMPSLWEPFVFNFVLGHAQGFQKNQWTTTQSQSAFCCDEWAQVLFSQLSGVVAIEAVSHPIGVGGIWGPPMIYWVGHCCSGDHVGFVRALSSTFKICQL